MSKLHTWDIVEPAGSSGLWEKDYHIWVAPPGSSAGVDFEAYKKDLLQGEINMSEDRDFGPPSRFYLIHVGLDYDTRSQLKDFAKEVATQRGWLRMLWGCDVFLGIKGRFLPLFKIFLLVLVLSNILTAAFL